MRNQPHYAETEYGFEYGPAKVERLCSGHPGWVVVGVTSAKGRVDIYVTKTGKIRVYRAGKGEMRDA